MNPKVSIIVTIFNREKYIEECARTLLEQTLQDIEYIFIDDASTDNSLELLNAIIRHYPKRTPLIKIIHLDENGGVSNARNIGIENATGDYIIHADSDDWVDLNMYERLYQNAIETNADIVGCNICHEYHNKTIILKQKYGNTINESISNLIQGYIHPSLCTSLTKTNLIREYHITFPEGLNMGEDLFFNLNLFIHSKTIIGIDFAPYHYRHTQDSSSFCHTMATIESGIMIGIKIEELMKKEGKYNDFAKEIEFRKFSLKQSLIQNFDNYNNYLYWLQVFPETHHRILSFNQIEWKLRIELWFAAHHMFYFAKAIKKMLEWQHKIRHL